MVSQTFKDLQKELFVFQIKVQQPSARKTEVDQSQNAQDVQAGKDVKTQTLVLCLYILL
jgi:hypothetical protein